MIAKTRIVRIGNSRGIRVPKGLLEHAQGTDQLLDAPTRTRFDEKDWQWR